MLIIKPTRVYINQSNILRSKNVLYLTNSYKLTFMVSRILGEPQYTSHLYHYQMINQSKLYLFTVQGFSSVLSTFLQKKVRFATFHVSTNSLQTRNFSVLSQVWITKNYDTTPVFAKGCKSMTCARGKFIIQHVARHCLKQLFIMSVKTTVCICQVDLIFIIDLY